MAIITKNIDAFELDECMRKLLQQSRKKPAELLIHDTKCLENVEKALKNQFKIAADEDEISASLIRVCLKLIDEAEKMVKNVISKVAYSKHHSASL